MHDLHLVDPSFAVLQISTPWLNAIKSAPNHEMEIGLAEEWATQSIKYEQWSLLAKVRGKEADQWVHDNS